MKAGPGRPGPLKARAMSIEHQFAEVVRRVVREELAAMSRTHGLDS
jgi:hypothetical protein